VSWALIRNSPSLVENRASRASSMDTSAASGRGRAIRARPSRSTSSPSPIDTARTAMPSTRAKQVNEMPPANQKFPICGGKKAARARRSSMGFAEGFAAGSRALMNG